MTQQLRDELARIAEHSPAVLIPNDAWSQGRRARARGRTIAMGAAVVLVAAVGGLATSVVGEPSLLRPATPVGEPAVPTRIEAVPDWLVQFPESPTSEVAWAPELDVVTDLAMGGAAAAFAVGEYGRLPVIVGAMDGRYLPLDLPGFADAATINHPSGQGSALALSPDGTRLAYAWWNPRAPLDAPMPAGVRLVDLTTGDITTIALEGGNGVDVDLLAWSPGGGWLAWYGQETGTWTPMSKGGRGDFVAGRIRLGSTTSEPVDVGRAEDTTIAISDGGQVAYWNGRSVTAAGRRIRVAGAGPGWWGPGRFAPGSDMVAVSDGSVGTLPLVDIATGREAYSPAPSDTPVGTEIRPHGWTPDGQVVVTSWTADDDSEATLALVDPTSDRWRSVGSVAPELLDSLTVATDLVSTDRPTIERPSPDWPWSIERRVGVGVVSGLVLLAGGFLLWRRRLAV